MPDRSALIRSLLAQRILVLDGAMGTMIQRYKLERGGLSRRALRRLRARPEGQQRSAVPDPAADHPGASTPSIWQPAPTSSKPTPSTPPRFRRPITTWSELVLRAERRRRPTGARGRRRMRPRRTRTSRASSPACSGRPRAPRSISPDVNDPGFRNVTFDQLVAAYLRSDRRPGRRRRRHPAGRDHFRHAQRQGRAVRHREVFRASRHARCR